MTLTINKSDTLTTFIATLHESNPVTSASVLEVVNKYTSKTTVFELPDDSSSYPTRFNKFIIPTTTFSGLSIGVYNFKIKDGSGNVTESGLLKVVFDSSTPEENVSNDYVYIQPVETDDDYLVYGE